MDFAEEANQQQARQSEQVARQSREIASAAHDLVEQDAAARRELLEAQARHQEQFRERKQSLTSSVRNCTPNDGIQPRPRCETP